MQGEDSPAHRKALADLRALDGPDWSESLDYLRAWFYELHRTRGYDMNGAVGFSYPMIESWARLTGRLPSPREVEALLVMDYAYRYPDAKRPGEAKKKAAREVPAWPTKKRTG